MPLFLFSIHRLRPYCFSFGFYVSDLLMAKFWAYFKFMNIQNLIILFFRFERQKIE